MKKLELNDYAMLKLILCGFLPAKITMKVGFFNYMMPTWVHLLIFRIQCANNEKLREATQTILKDIIANGQS